MGSQRVGYNWATNTHMISLYTLATLPVIPISVKGITIHPLAKANTREINFNFSFHHLPTIQSIGKSYCFSLHHSIFINTNLATSLAKIITIISSRLVPGQGSTCSHLVSIYHAWSQNLFIAFASVMLFLKYKVTSSPCLKLSSGILSKPE